AVVQLELELRPCLNPAFDPGGVEPPGPGVAVQDAQLATPGLALFGGGVRHDELAVADVEFVLARPVDVQTAEPHRLRSTLGQLPRLLEVVQPALTGLDQAAVVLHVLDKVLHGLHVVLLALCLAGCSVAVPVACLERGQSLRPVGLPMLRVRQRFHQAGQLQRLLPRQDLRSHVALVDADTLGTTTERARHAVIREWCLEAHVASRTDKPGHVRLPASCGTHHAFRLIRFSPAYRTMAGAHRLRRWTAPGCGGPIRAARRTDLVTGTARGRLMRCTGAHRRSPWYGCPGAASWIRARRRRDDTGRCGRRWCCRRRGRR